MSLEKSMFRTFVLGLNLPSALAARQDCRKARKWGRSTRVHRDLGELERALDFRIMSILARTAGVISIEEVNT